MKSASFADADGKWEDRKNKNVKAKNCINQNRKLQFSQKELFPF